MAFTGEGAKRWGGRWNSPGTPMVYAAESQSLAALELLVHLDQPEVLHGFLVIPVQIPPAMVETLALEKLPRTWRSSTTRTRAMGDAWARENRSAVLRVPSAVVPSESNFLLNPAHPDYEKLVVGKARPFDMDPRLRKAK